VQGDDARLVGALSNGFELGWRHGHARVAVHGRRDQPKRPEPRFMPLRQDVAANAAVFLTGIA